MVLTDAPGAVIVGVAPPSSRGPREENGIIAYSVLTWLP